MCRFLFPIALGLVALSILGPVLAEEEAPDPNEQAEEYAKEFKKNYKKITEAEAIEGIDKLAALYNSKEVDDKKAKKAILDALSKTIALKSPAVVSHCLKKCGEVGEDSVKIVLVALGRELKKKVPEDRVYEAAFGSLSKIHSESKAATKTLIDLLKYKEDAIVAQAAFAMVGYKEASGKVRKELFEEVLKSSEGVYSQSQAQNENMKRKWTIIGDDVMEALNTLCVPPRAAGDKFDDPSQARKWFNKNKKAPWDQKE